MKLDNLLKAPDITYDDKEHSYRRNSDGKLLPGCSTIANLYPKPYLVKWSTKENFNFMVENWDISHFYTAEEKFALLQKAKDAYIRKQKEAMAYGKIVHDWFEKHIKGEKEPEVPPETKRAVDMFLAWEKENVQEWVASELLVTSNRLEVAGRLDAVAVLKYGIKAVVDLKTSNEISEDYALQTVGYQECLEEMGYPTDKRLIIRFPKTEVRKLYNKETRSYFEEPNLLEVKTIMTDREEDLKIFEHLRLIYDRMEK